jgi:hypothetical protein
VYHASLQFAVAQANDGLIAGVSLRHLHPDGVDGETISELVEAGLWEATGSSIQITRYELEQPTAAKMASFTTGARERKRAERARKSHQTMSHVTPKKESTQGRRDGDVKPWGDVEVKQPGSGRKSA